MIHLCMASISLWGDKALGFLTMGIKYFFCQLATLNTDDGNSPFFLFLCLSLTHGLQSKKDCDNWKYKLLSRYTFIENKRIFIFILLPVSCTEEIIQREILLTQHFWHIILCVLPPFFRGCFWFRSFSFLTGAVLREFTVGKLEITFRRGVYKDHGTYLPLEILKMQCVKWQERKG